MLRSAFCSFCSLVFLSGVALAQGMATGASVPRVRKPLPAGVEPPLVRYVDIAAQAGLTAANVSGAERGKQYIVETTGTGVAVIDFDNDGLQDLLFVNAGRLNSDGPPPPHRLYRNVGGLKFADVTEGSGIRNNGWGQGVCAGDIDEDGKVDLFITHWGHNVFYRNLGGGKFEDQTKLRNLYNVRPRWSTGCAFLDYDRDGDLDLFVANYVDFDISATPKPGEKAQCKWKDLPVMCGPRGLPAETMSLYRNDGRGGFTDVSEKAGVAGPRNYYGFTVLTGDFDNDGWPDVYVACDSTASLLYRNKRNGTFEEIGVESGTAYNEDGREQAGMGATAGDYNRDGRLDIFKTNFSDDTPTLYRNTGDSFEDATISAGLAVNTKFLGWGAAFVDVDHDGWKDLFEANGHVYPEVDAAGIGESFRQQRVLYWNVRGGAFHDISAAAGPGILARHSSRGIAVADLDNDGAMEFVIVNMHEPPSLLKNTVRPAGNWLMVRALTASGRDAVGARVTVTSSSGRQFEEVRSGGYHISQGDFRVHFGLGGDTEAQVEIRWPNGRIQHVGSTRANSAIVVREAVAGVGSGKRPL